MQIKNLTLLASDADLNEIVSRFLPRQKKIDDVHLAIIPEGVRVTGTYHAAVGVPFAGLWSVFVHEGKLAARLASIKAGPFSLGLAKSSIVRAIAAAVPMLELRGDLLLLDVDALICEKVLPLRTNLKSIACDYGTLVIESGRSA